MPSRGSYQVAPDADPPAPTAAKSRPPPVDPEKCQPPTRPDTSFRDCVLSLALVLLIIAILVLAVRPWDSGHGEAPHHGSSAAAHGRHNQSKSTPRPQKTTTTLSSTATTPTSSKETTTHPIERHDEVVTNVDYDYDELSSSPASPSTTTSWPSESASSASSTTDGFVDYDYQTPKVETTTEMIARRPQTTVKADEDYPVDPVDETTSTSSSTASPTTTTSRASDDYPEGESEGSPETTTRLTASSSEEQYPPVHRAATTTESSDTEAPTTEHSGLAERRQEDNDVVTTEDTTSSNDKDFDLAVGNYYPTTGHEGGETTTEAAADFEETATAKASTPTTTRRHTLAKYVASETTLSGDHAERTTVEELDQKPRVCKSPECKKQSARMLGLMDHSTTPCQDFYQFACGGLRDNALLAEEDPDSEAMARIRDELAKVDNASTSAALLTFRRFYDQCVEDVGDKDRRVDRFSTSGKNAVESIGKLYTVTDWKSEEFDLTELLTRLMLQHSSPLIDVSLDVSSVAADKFALKLTPPVMPPLLRPGRNRPGCLDVVPDESDLNEVYRQYLDCMSDHSRYMQEVEAAVKVFRLFPQVNATHHSKLVLDIRQNIEFQVWDSDLLSELPSEGEKRRVLMAKEYTPMTVRKLQDSYSMIDWRTLLSRLLGIEKAELPDSAEVQVYFLEYLDKLFSNLQNCKDTRSLHNALVAMYARDLYAHVLIGGPRCERKERCLRVAVSLMEDVASSLYLSSFNSADLDKMEQETRRVFARLRETLELQLKDAKWLDPGSRSDLVSKLHQMRLDVSGGRGLFADLALVDKRMAGIDLSVSNDLMKLSTALTARYRKLMYSLYDKSPNIVEAGWTHFMLPFKTTAVSVYGLNSVMVPFGMLTWPLYDPAMPRHVTLARLGFVVAHEMAHHFDPVGIKYRAGGGKRESVLISGPASAAFDFYATARCSVHSRYDSGTSHTEPDKSIYTFDVRSTKLSLNERLADDTASALSLDAALRWQNATVADPTLPDLGYTSTKEHFLAVAQMFCTKAGVSAWRVDLFEREHPPPPMRVNDMLMNSAAFAAAYSCPAGSAMSPSYRCQVFPALSPEEDDESYDDTQPPNH